MARTLDVFVDAPGPPEAFVRETESLLGVQFRRRQDDDQLYDYDDARVSITLGPHELENDRDMKFQDYRYQLSVQARNIATEDERRSWREAFGRKAFDAFKRTKKYRIMLVDDVQRKLDEFTPGS